MSWARIDDGFHDHPKVDELSLAAVGLWTLSLTWAHRHRKTALIPGHITEARVRKIAGKHADALTAELVAARLWDVEVNIGGWVIHDFADYLPKGRDPEEAAASGRKGAQAKWQKQGKEIADSHGTSQADSHTDSQQTASKEPGSQPPTSMAPDGSRASAPAFPSRPDPSREVNQLGGDRNETLAPPPETKPPPDDGRPTRPADARCTAHQGVADPGPCRGCGQARERAERKADAAAERSAIAYEAAVRDCPDCEGTHFVLDADKKPTRRKCGHPNVRRTA